MMGLDGEVTREFVTLLNPERDIGPTSIHGLQATDVSAAPRFVDVAGVLLETLDGCVALAGHNIRFDHSFLSVEFARLGQIFPNGPTVCTMRLAGGGSLSSCCEDYGISFAGDKHTALHDARATAQLLATLLRDTPREASKLTQLTPITWPRITKCPVRLLTRDESRKSQAKPPTYLQKLFAKAENDLVPVTDDSAILAYTALLDRVLLDRYVDDTETQSLLDVATRWGVPGNRIREAHRQYLKHLARAALADGIITEVERRDLCQVASILGIHGGELEEILEMASRGMSRGPTEEQPPPEPLSREQLAGKRVCFTGECQCRFSGQMITRETATELAMNQGVIVVETVTKNLDLLVVADPQTQSGKAKKARKYGIRIMHEVVFWKTLGVHVD
jgi:DNA polymerase-3 subunit epsilon